MTVWVTESGEYEQRSVMGVADSLENAVKQYLAENHCDLVEGPTKETYGRDAEYLYYSIKVRYSGDVSIDTSVTIAPYEVFSGHVAIG